jgi:phage/plasmid-like protein (TIGR03299 family)
MMTAAVETLAYAGEVPWHGLGVPVTNDLTPKQMLKAAKLDWTVSKRPMFFKDKAGKPVESSTDFALVRDSDDYQLSSVGEGWKPVQNEAAFDFFTKFVKDGKMTMETAGSLWNGRYVWALARTGKDFAVGNKHDEVRSYLLLMSPHVHGKALIKQFTPIRVVCWNTLNFALGERLRGNDSAFRMTHAQKYDEQTKSQAEQALGLVVAQSKEFQEASALLAKKRVKEDKVESYFCEVLQWDPKKAEKKDGEESERTPRMLPKFRAALTHAPGAQLPSALGTMWGALNAVTHVVDHETGHGDRSTALKNAWLGHTAGIKRRAFDLAVKVAA